MGKRKKWDLPSEQSGALAVLSIAVLLGGSAGCVLAALSTGEGAGDLSEYLSDYLLLAQSGGLPRGLWPVLWGQLKYLLAVLVLSLTALGTVGLPLVFGARGFSLAFPVACFWRVFGWRGLFPAFVLFGLPALLWMPALLLIGVPGFWFSQRLLRRVPGEDGSLSPSAVGWYRVGIGTALTLTAGVLECMVVPVLLRAAARLVL